MPTSPPPDLVQGIRYARHLGQKTPLQRGQPPQTPRWNPLIAFFGVYAKSTGKYLKHGLSHLPTPLRRRFERLFGIEIPSDTVTAKTMRVVGAVGTAAGEPAFSAIIQGAVVVAVLILFFGTAIPLTIALATAWALTAWAVPSFRRWLLPGLRGDPMDSTAFLAQASKPTLYAIGAFSGAVVFIPWYMLQHTTPLQQPFIFGLSLLYGALFFRRSVIPAAHGKTLFTILPRPQKPAAPSEPEDLGPGEFGLWVGTATGRLAELGSETAISAGTQITLRQRDAAKNFNIFGETGTGKTTCVISPLVLQALEFDSGALIFDIRGDYAATVERLAMLAGKPIKRIGVGHLGVNLLQGLTPDTAAGFVHSALKLLGQGQGDSGFWVGMALNRCRAAFTILEHYGDPEKKEHFSLKGLYSFVFDSKFRERAIGIASALRDEHPPESHIFRRLQNAIAYEENNADKHEEKTSAGIKATIETALAQFADPDLEDAFCSSDGEKANIADVLDGTAFVVNVSRSRFKAAARIVYLLIKERFFQAINSREDMPPCSRKDRPVFFICDEYQQIASGTDQDFFDTSRGLNAIGVVASQSIEAYYAAIGNRDTTTALLGNFTNIIAFRSTPATLEYIASRLGDSDRPKSKQIEEESVKNDWETTYQKRSIDEQERRRLLDPALIRSLEPGKAVALLSVGGYAFDDVISLRQILNDDLPQPPTKAPSEPPPTAHTEAS